MRYISAVLFVILGTYIGYIFGEGEKKRQNELLAFLDIFENIRYKISVFSLPTKSLFQSLDNPLLEKYGFFEELNKPEKIYKNRWENAVNSIRKRLSLYDNEIEIIKAFGKNIGFASKEIQIKAFDQGILELTKIINVQKSEIQGKIKAFRALGFAVGAMIGILFI